jgi:hypothetical protein
MDRAGIWIWRGKTVGHAAGAGGSGETPYTLAEYNVSGADKERILSKNQLLSMIL